jgi:hypothetical protein
MSFKSRYNYDDDERAALRAEAAEDADREHDAQLRRDEDDERDSLKAAPARNTHVHPAFAPALACIGNGLFVRTAPARRRNRRAR